MPTEQPTGPQRRLETIFLTGPGGLVYEIPRDLAAQYVVTPERERELGHLPITPYPARVTDADGDAWADDEESEVGGRHLAPGPSGAMRFHRESRFGTYRAADGYFYQGEHCHPFGDDLGRPS